MRVRVKSGKVNLRIPVPFGVVGVVLRLLPESAFEEMGKDLPEEYKILVSKQTALLIWKECRDALLDCKGLEVVKVKAHDGTRVSIRI